MRRIPRYTVTPYPPLGGTIPLVGLGGNGPKYRLYKPVHLNLADRANIIENRVDDKGQSLGHLPAGPPPNFSTPKIPKIPPAPKTAPQKPIPLTKSEVEKLAKSAEPDLLPMPKAPPKKKRKTKEKVPEGDYFKVQ